MFNYRLRHVPGTRLGKVDALSRVNQDASEGGGELPVEEVLLPSEVFIQAIQNLEPINTDIKQCILACKTKDSIANHRLRLALQHTSSTEKCTPPNWDIQDNLLVFRGQVYIPKDTKLQQDLIKEAHDSPTTGHPGCYKTQEILQRTYWWPTLARDVNDYVTGCATCQENKVITHRNSPDLMPISTEHHLPFQSIAMEFIMDLPQSNGFDSCLVVTDHDCAKAMVFIPCNKTVTASETATLYQNHVFRRFGLPVKAISNRGPQFAS
ncbi:uncharacterized protein FIBRA_09454 [Fibroporia radiculosa]|uniref:Integrase zinc-binding domain-containing protein n=1 Tax=Fibroporia radiculosa TaxID=599839 RepID=J7RW22_9APHY|nr:uncharacterized protein FIBRA_09454 [Fibroporia radiculosa]CCM07120.1 predicted protein [Fibroporia radiculosa]